MINSKITVNYTDDIGLIVQSIIYFTDTRTSTSGFIQCKNYSGNILSPLTMPPYFISNALYNLADFTTTIPVNGSMCFQANNDYLVFTDYKELTISHIEITTGFTFDITSVVVPDVSNLPPLPLDERTVIDSATKIKFCNSPIFIREPATNTTKSIKINLYIWDGLQNAIVPQPNYVLVKDKVSVQDNYISIEVSDLVRPYITPQFAYNRAAPPAITNQGVFLQAEIITFDNDNNFTSRYTSTYFVTLGYKWNYEQNIIADNGVDNYGASGFVVPVNKWYNPKINNYFLQDFDFTKLVADASTSNIVRYNGVTPAANWKRCTLDPCLIVFINKLGLWETFTSHGKVTVTTQGKRTDANISHRDPSQVDNTYTHSRLNNSLEVTQNYLINSGSLVENMTSIIEELIYSPKVYLIRFKGDIEETTTVGITIDSTYITIDNTYITIDSQTITDEALGFFKTHQQIPVIIVDEDFTRKTRLNDKNAIDYNIKFAETNNKINQIR